MSKIEQVETLKNIMVSRARGGEPSESDYQECRQAIIADPVMEKLAPSFVRTCRRLSDFWPYIKGKYSTYAERQLYINESFERLLSYLESADASPSDGLVSEAIGTFNSEHIQLSWAKALERRSSDPDGAITMARTLLEGICKHILDDCKVDYGSSPDINKLYRLTAEQLNLSPGAHSDPVFKQILGGCTAVVEGLGAIRNRHGDAHGSGRQQIRASPRHAELAVNLAGAMASYLLATWEYRQEKASPIQTLFS